MKASAKCTGITWKYAPTIGLFTVVGCKKKPVEIANHLSLVEKTTQVCSAEIK